MANHNTNGGRDNGLPDEQRASWRPQDQSPQASSHRGRNDDDDRGWRDRSYRERDDDRRGDRDPRRWEGSRGSELGYHEDRDAGWRTTERYGQGQSGYSAGRHDDRAHRIQGRNEMYPPVGSYEDRHQDLGVDDRFTGRGRSPYWPDRADERMGPSTPPGSPAGYGGSSYSGGGYSSGGHSGNQGASYGQRPQMTQDDSQRSGSSVRGPHRGRGPIGYQRSDERIREMVCEALTDDEHIDASHIEVSVRNGEVTLSGVVDDRRTKRAAEDCAYAISGVRDIQNQLRVREDDRSSRSNLLGHGSVGNHDIETLHSDRKPRA